MQIPLLRNNHCSKLFIAILLSGLLSGCIKDHPYPPAAHEENADVVYGWYKFIIRLQLYTSPAPNVIQNNRNLGYVGVGLYEAVRPGIKGAGSLSSKLYQMPAMPETETGKHYFWSASANAALASLFKLMLGGLTDANKASIDSLENAYNERFQLRIPDAVLDRSQAFGRSVATAIFNWSATDNFNLSSVGYVLPVFAGSWVPTPPAFANPVGPFLANSRPFLESSLTADAPPLPFPYSEDPSSEFYAAAKEVYDIGKTLTADQKAIANWWADVGGPGVGYAGAGHPLFIITQVLESKRAKLGQAAEIYAKTGIAFKDAFYRVWKSKFEFSLLRPVTYINKLIDAAWLTHLPTPPYPDYLSGLVGVYSPVMQVLKREFGDIRLTDHAYDWRGDTPRQYPSLSKLVDEAASSRVYAGIHYQFTQDITVKFGKELGNEIADIRLVKHGNH